MEQTDANEIPERALEVLAFWFQGRAFDAPGLDARMKVWFGSDDVFDAEVRQRFAPDIDLAARGEYREWISHPRGRLALILVLDQFPRNVARGTAGAFAHDGKALALTLDGIRNGLDRGLAPIERAFFYMPLQHAENLRVQALGGKAFRALAERVDETRRETFQTMAEFAELHHDIIERFGRFPHRNAVLGREATAEEQAYLGNGAPDFGQ